MSEQAFVVRTFPNSVEAEFARAVLDANGIASMVLKDNAAGMLPFLDVLHPVRLVVRRGDVEPVSSSGLPIGLFGGGSYTTSRFAMAPP